MLFLVLAYLVSASITIGIAAVATVLLGFFCLFLSIAMKNKVTCYFEVPDMAEKEQQVYGKLIFENHSLLPAGRLRAELLFQNLLTGEKEICHLDSMAAGKKRQNEMECLQQLLRGHAEYPCRNFWSVICWDCF